jgi:hypothetical protein
MSFLSALKVILATVFGWAAVGCTASGWLAQLAQAAPIPHNASIPKECHPEYSAQEASQLRLRPPAEAYHFGKRTPLLSDVRSQAIPVEDWNTFIRGQHSTWRLKPFRQGLYLSARLSNAETFASPSDPWVIKIKLKEECLTPTRVGSVDFIQDSRFKIWYESLSKTPLERGSFLSFLDWAKRCTLSSSLSWVDRFKVEYYHSQKPENECEITLNHYFNAMNFALVIDSIIPESYALRDRDCIRSIQGTALEVLHFYSQEGALEDPCQRAGNHIDKLRILAQALAYLSRDEAQSLLRSDLNSGLNHSLLVSLTTQFNKLPAGRFSVSDRLKTVIQAFKRCVSRHQLPDFQALVLTVDPIWLQDRTESSALSDPETEFEIIRSFEALCR